VAVVPRRGSQPGGGRRRWCWARKGAVTAAPNLDDAVKRARQALALHVEGMAEDGEPIPPPSGFTEVIKDNPDAMPVLVPLPLTRTVFTKRRGRR
jgi:hypothetical protein